MVKPKTRQPPRVTQPRAPRTRAPAPAVPPPQQAPRAHAAAPRNGRVNAAEPDPRRNQDNKLVNKVNHEDAALVNFLDGLTNPDAPPCRVPLLLGEFVLESNVFQAEYSGTVTAPAGGKVYVAAAPDNWVTLANDGTPYNQFSAYAGGTQGAPVWTSLGASATTPAPAAAAGATNSTYASPVLDPGSGAATRMRVTAVHLEIWSDAPAQTAQGDLTVAVIQNAQAAGNFPLNSADYGTIVQQPQDWVAHVEYPLAGWKSGQRVCAHLTQWDEQCFALETLPTAGQLTAPIFCIAAFGSGMSSGQTLSYKITISYEMTKGRTYQYLPSAGTTPYLEPARVYNALRPLRGKRPTIGPAGHAAGKGANAMVMANPDKAQALMRPGKTNPTFTDNLSTTAKKGLSWLAGKIPYVGGLAQSAVDWLFD